jgi:hypothetical protein
LHIVGHKSPVGCYNDAAVNNTVAEGAMAKTQEQRRHAKNPARVAGETPEKKTDELSDEQLEQIRGGVAASTGTNTTNPTSNQPTGVTGVDPVLGFSRGLRGP